MINSFIFAAGLTVTGLVWNSYAIVPSYSGWTVIWSDDFNGIAGSGLSSDWLYTTGTSYPGGPANFGTGEVETNTASTANVYQDGQGNLAIKAIRNASGAWTSGRVETVRADFQPPPSGQLSVEARIQLPNLTGAAAMGYWPAFWILGAPYRGNWWNWPGIGEMDIMENVQGTNTEYGTLHCDVAPGGECNEDDGISGNTPGGSPTLEAGFHTYRLEWDMASSPQQIRWYLDGVEFHQVLSTQLSPRVWSAITNHGYYIICNLAIGGQFPQKQGGGPTASTTSDGTLLFDYIAVYSKTGGGTAGGGTTSSLWSTSTGTASTSSFTTTSTTSVTTDTVSSPLPTTKGE